MQRDTVVSKASELLRLGLMPTPAELKAGKVSCGLVLIKAAGTLTASPQDLLSVDIQTVASKSKVV